MEKYFLEDTFGVHSTSLDAQFVQTYNKDLVKHAYRSNRRLRRFGADAPSAIERMKVETPKEVDDRFAREAMPLLGSQGGRDAAVRMWHEVSREEHRGHKAVHDLLELATGLPGLHVAGDPDTAHVEAKTIRELLGYPVGPRGGVSTKGSASAEVIKKLKEIVKELEEYIPHIRIKPFRGEVKLKRVICTLDAVLLSMYGCSFARAAEGTGYLLQRSELFNEQLEDPRDEDNAAAAPPLRPTLPGWGWGLRRFLAPEDHDAQQQA